MTEQEMLAIKEAAEEWLFELPGVTGVGLTRKRVDGRFTDTFAIIIYVEKKRPLDEIPPAERVPAEIGGIPTDVIESPSIVVRAGPPDENEYAVLKAGIRIGAGGKGTLGFIGRTTAGYPRGPGLSVLVSNEHVIRGETLDVEPGSSHSVGQPSTHGCCESCDFCSRIVGHDRVASVLNEDVDGGVAELNPGVQWMPDVQDTPASVPIVDIRAFTAADVPLPVWKRGAETLRTTASATDPNMSTPVFLHGNRFHRSARRSIRIEGAGFSDGGDSGAPILDNSNRMIGVLFGGGGTVSVACHIHQMQSFLHVEARTAANTPPGVQTVPAPPVPVLNDRNMHGPPLPQVASAGPGVTVLLRAPSSLYNDVAQTDFGRAFLRSLLVHKDEIRRLARRPRVIATWRRCGGGYVTARISHGIPEDEILVPSTYDGRAAIDCAAALARAVTRYSSAALAHDIHRYLPYVPGLAGTTVREFLAALRTLSVPPD